MSGKLSPWLLLPALAIGASACVEEPPTVPPPLEQLYFPSSVAMTPPEAGEELLLVASSNFDLRYRSGVLHAFSVDAIDRLVEEALRAPSPGCPPEAPRCSPVRIESFGDAFRGAAEIGSFAGEIAVATLDDGSLRAFVPIRSDQTVVGLEVSPGDPAPLRCLDPGQERCRGVRFPREDPFSAVAAAGNVYVGHVGIDRDDRPRGIIGAARADDPMWSGGGGDFRAIGLGREPAGGLATRCTGAGAEARCTLYASGRSFTDAFNPVFLFDFDAGALQRGPLFSANVFAQQRGFDARGVAISSDGEALYVASRFPSAIATIDVTRLDPAPLDGCVVAPADPIACPEGPVEPGAEPNPRFATAALAAAPPGANYVGVIPRTLPDGSQSDLVVLTTGQGLWFHDTRIGAGAGAVEEVGTEPAGMPFRQVGEGVRLYVPSFGHGSLAVVDMTDVFRPATARVVAILGRRQEGSF